MIQATQQSTLSLSFLNPIQTLGLQLRAQSHTSRKKKMRVTKRVLWIFMAKVNPQPNQQISLKDKSIIVLYVDKTKHVPKTKFARHLERHVNENAEIAQALQFRKSSKDRKVILEKFRNLGNFKHNQLLKPQDQAVLK